MNRRPPQPRDRASLTRHERKTRNHKKPDYLAGFRNLLLLLLIAQSLRVAFASPRLKLKEVQVHGSRRLTPADVAKAGQVPLGENIFRVNLIRVSDRLRKDPMVRRAVVTRELPNSLNVEIEDRTPAYQVSCTGKRWDVDAENVVFRPAVGYMHGKPLLELQTADLPALGRKLRPELAYARVECGKLAQKEGLALRHLRIDPAGELWLNILTEPAGATLVVAAEEATDKEEAGAAEPVPGRLKVRVGRIADLPQKFRDIRQALAGWPNLTSTAMHLDVMCAGRPAYLKAADAGKNGERSP